MPASKSTTGDLAASTVNGPLSAGPSPPARSAAPCSYGCPGIPGALRASPAIIVTPWLTLLAHPD